MYWKQFVCIPYKGVCFTSLWPPWGGKTMLSIYCQISVKPCFTFCLSCNTCSRPILLHRIARTFLVLVYWMSSSSRRTWHFHSLTNAIQRAIVLYSCFVGSLARLETTKTIVPYRAVSYRTVSCRTVKYRTVSYRKYSNDVCRSTFWKELAIKYKWSPWSKSQM